ncbi:aspartic proteinase nepenthesin-1-like [Iris pallida]|uniref:Aspartic proteinase nepenthesin-1-like n=1 Tax=Iris pallida TaxID=29817 RepID=A0AAX6HZQ7_IRIPA|nr:aspartic proteinase nepenthesin-1-like [Iris pallida]
MQLLLIFVVLFATAAAPSSCAAAANATAAGGLRVDLTRVDSSRNFSKLELLQRATLRSNHRMSRLVTRMHVVDAGASKAASSAAAANGRSPVHAGNGEFLMDLSIGTPSVPFSAIVDTGSDLVWTQCKPCVECFDQPTPIFDPSSSSTFSKLPCAADLCSALPTSTCNSDGACEYLYTYGDSSSTQGVLGSETFTFGSSKDAVSVPHVGFGCGDKNEGGGFSQGSGLVGLGRGPLSLTSQLGVSKFSYCLTSLDETSKKSPLLFGSLAVLKESGGGGGTAVLSTPISKNPLQPSFYYLSLKGITVGGARVKIPSTTFELQSDGTGGLIIDSGTSITYLEEAGYKAVKKAFLSQVKLPVADGSDVGLDLCFSMPTGSSSAAAAGTTDVEVPKLTFHFEGADLELPGENYMVLDSNSGLLCLTMMGSSGMSIFGNFQQQNTQILYDLEKNTLSFVPANCADL